MFELTKLSILTNKSVFFLDKIKNTVEERFLWVVSCRLMQQHLQKR